MRSARWRDDSVAHRMITAGRRRQTARRAAAVVIVAIDQASEVTDRRASAARAAQRRPAVRGSAVDRPAQTRQETEVKRSMGQQVKGKSKGTRRRLPK